MKIGILGTGNVGTALGNSWAPHKHEAMFGTRDPGSVKGSIRSTGDGAFWGLLSGTFAAALTHGTTIAENKGGWLANWHTFPSVMAQNFWIAIVAWTTCFVVTVAISWATIPRPEEELAGLGRWSVQDPSENRGGLRQTLFWATLALCVCTVLNLIFG